MNELEQEAMEYKDEQMEGGEELELLERSEANFMYWSKMPFWTLDESVALLLGKNPEIVKWNVVRHYVNYYYTTELCSDYARLRTLILRAFEKKEIEEQNSPIIFLEWAEHKGIEIPKILKQQIAEIKNKIIDSKVGTSESCLAPTESIIELEDLLKQKDEEIDLLGEKVRSFQKRIEELEGLIWEGFDESLDTYPKELDIAFKAYKVISKNWKKSSSIKKQFHLWLQENYPKLSNEEKERIAKVCNWQKGGGAPCTPSL